jgi:hypothetical protein
MAEIENATQRGQHIYIKNWWWVLGFHSERLVAPGGLLQVSISISQLKVVVNTFVAQMTAFV